MFQTTLQYSLSSDAQRAEIMRTGAPVTQTQIVAGEVAVTDLDLFYFLPSGELAGFHTSSHMMLAEVWPQSAAPGIQTFESLMTAIRQGDGALKAKAELKLAEQERRKRVMAAFLADPTAIPNSYTGNDSGLWNVVIGADEFTSNELSRNPEFAHECKVRVDASNRAKLLAVLEANKAAEMKVRAYQGAWLAEHGTDIQKLQFAEGLLCVSELGDLIRNASFAAIKWEKYSKMVKSDVPCTREEDNCCGTVAWEKMLVTCIPTDEYKNLVELRKQIPAGATVELLKHRGYHPQCDGELIQYGAKVTIEFPFGPYVEEYAL